MFDKNNENYKLYLAGIITENQYYDLIESNLQRGQLLNVRWKMSDKIHGELNSEDMHNYKVYKIVFPSRGKDKDCCFKHVQQVRFMFDTKPNDPEKGAIIADPLPCKECQEISKLLGKDYEIISDMPKYGKKPVNFLISKNSNYPAKIELSATYDKKNVEKIIDVIKERTQENKEFDEILKSIKDGTLKYPKFNVPAPKFYSTQNINPELFKKFYHNNASYHIYFGKKLWETVKVDDDNNSQGDRPLSYEKLNLTLYDKPLVEKVLSSYQGDSYLSPDEMGYRSDTYYNTKQIPWDELDQEIKDFAMENKKEIEKEYEHYKNEILPNTIKNMDFRKWRRLLVQWEKNLTPEEQNIMQIAKRVPDNYGRDEFIYIADFLNVDRESGQKK